MKVTINDIAKMTNVSKSTVSRYLNGGSVSKKTAIKISKAIEATGYQANLFASNLKKGRTGMIGVMFKGIQSVSVGKLLEQIDFELKMKQLYPLLMIENSSNNPNQEAENLLKLAKQGVDGIILGTDKLTIKHLEVISSLDIPVILAGQHNDYIPYRKLDNHKAGYIVGEHLRAMGHSKLAFIGPGDKDREVGYARRNGVIESYQSTNCPMDLTEYLTGYTFEDGYKHGEDVLKTDVTAAICSTDRIAMGLMQYLNEKKVPMPERLSIVGFGNYDFSKVVNPSLTTVEFDYLALGRQVVIDIMELIDGRTIDVPKDITISLVKRNSVKQLNKESL
jgi:LacI family sucrose operon transcriptional repressor